MANTQEFGWFCLEATDSQLENIFLREINAFAGNADNSERLHYAQVAVYEMRRRNISIPEIPWQEYIW